MNKMVKMIEMMIPIIGNASGQVVSVGLWISAGWVPFCRSLEPSRFCRPLMNYNALFGSFFKICFPAGSLLEPGCLPGFLLPFNAADEEFFGSSRIFVEPKAEVYHLKTFNFLTGLSSSGYSRMGE